MITVRARSIGWLAIAAAVSVLYAGCAQESQPSVAPSGAELVHVDSSMFAGEPIETRVLLDLTTPGIVYEIDGSDAALDLSRIDLALRSGRTLSLSDWLSSQERPINTQSRFRLAGDARDLTSTTGAEERDDVGVSTAPLTARRTAVGVRGVFGGVKTLGYTCSGLMCTCSGDADCNDMFTSDVCGDVAVCDENGCSCLRI
jgi:hypothetical protein